MPGSQDDIFQASEADNWFRRNREALGRFDPGLDLPLRLLDLYDLRPRSVLEIGAANGYRVAAIAHKYGARATAVEPSAEAIADGAARYPEVAFVQATGSQVPLTATFDLVVVNFVFHWIDRAMLLRSVAEVDRLLRDGGFLIIGDFLPSNRLQVQYHHLPGEHVYTYKQDYAAVFQASGLYHPIGLFTGRAGSKRSEPAPEDERTGVWLLQKQLSEHYQAKPFQPGA